MPNELEHFLKEIFHHCAFTAYAEAMAEGKHMDSPYVKQLAYRYYEQEKRNEQNQDIA